jgi:hypothetical protein
LRTIERAVEERFAVGKILRMHGLLDEDDA